MNSRKQKIGAGKIALEKVFSIIIPYLLVSVSVLTLPIVTVQAEITIDTPTPGQVVHVGDEVWVNRTAGVGELVEVSRRVQI